MRQGATTPLLGPYVRLLVCRRALRPHLMRDDGLPLRCPCLLLREGCLLLSLLAWVGKWRWHVRVLLVTGDCKRESCNRSTSPETALAKHLASGPPTLVVWTSRSRSACVGGLGPRPGRWGLAGAEILRRGRARAGVATSRVKNSHVSGLVDRVSYGRRAVVSRSPAVTTPRVNASSTRRTRFSSPTRIRRRRCGR